MTMEGKLTLPKSSSKQSKCIISSKSYQNRSECKTPPLPNLLKHRDLLKVELLKYEEKLDKVSINCKQSEILKSEHKHRKRSKSYSNKHKKYREESFKKPKNDVSPELAKDLIDSDEEENIIEQRRMQRKQLLKKLELTQAIKFENEDLNGNGNSISNISDLKIQTENRIEKKEQITDMFAEKDDYISNNGPENIAQDNSVNSELIDNWDDSEGYFNIKLGDGIDKNRYLIKSLLGKGVFANVVRAQDTKNSNMEVAIKISRNNDLIFKRGLKEMSILKELNDADPEGKHHCVSFLRNFMHKGHLCIVLESMFMDLRSIIKKYGRNGLSMKAITSYSKQLLLSLRHLKKLNIIHADIKPDNILVNEKKNMLKLCDFGSAEKVHDNEPTPYLVSRFYRAPEIIIGVPYSCGVDIWSAACTIFEMATGKILFTGGSNNKMLKCFADVKGRFPNKLIRKGIFKDQHFNYNNNFLYHKKDTVTGREKVIEITNLNPTRDLLDELKKSCKGLINFEEKQIVQLKSLLDKMLALDQNLRYSPTDCLKHPFIFDAVIKSNAQ